MEKTNQSSFSSMEKTNQSSFSSMRAYTRSLTQLPTRLSTRSFATTTPQQETTHIRARSGTSMARTLRWHDLIGLGLGGMVGAGVFVATGRAARIYAGPAIVVSYAIAGLCALLSAFCYTEFAVDMPVAGGAFSYLRVTFGEFAAFLTGANLIMEYVFSNAAVARSFTAYLGTAIGVATTERWRITVSGLPDGFNQIDLLAVGVVVIISIVICYSTKESSVLNMTLTVLHIAFILFIIIMGFWRGDIKNFTHPANPEKSPGGFLPYGISGVFNGAAVVYLSYIGYDAVSTMAEEVKEPSKDIPIGVSGSVVIVTVLYCFMAVSMCLLVPYDAIDIESPFSGAFVGSSGWGWVSNVIGVGASFGILTSLLVAMLGQARYLCVFGRSGLVPAWFAKVSPVTQTPVNASIFLGFFTAALALVTDLEVLLNLISIGTLFVFYMVGNAVIFRRYYKPDATSSNRFKTLSFLLCFSFFALCFTLTWQFLPTSNTLVVKPIILSVFAVGSIVSVCAFKHFVPEAHKPEFWGVPLMPWIPAISIFLNVFLLGSLDGPSYVRFGVFSVVVVLFYLFYSVHASYDAEEKGGPIAKVGDEGLQEDGLMKV